MVNEILSFLSIEDLRNMLAPFFALRGRTEMTHFTPEFQRNCAYRALSDQVFDVMNELLGPLAPFEPTHSLFTGNL
jgi:hypothetical protein